MAKPGYIYLICDPSTDLFKIGLTTGSIENRLKKLQTGNGTEMHVVTYHQTKYPYKVEKMLHNRFFSKKELNEWFKLDSDDIKNFNDACNEIEVIISSLSDNPFFKPS